MKKFGFTTIGLIACGLAATVASAQRPPEYPSIVPLFDKTCLSGELSMAARESGIVADGRWTSVATPVVNVPGFNISRAIEKNFDFSKPESVKEWERIVDGTRVRVVLAQFPAKRRYPVLCAFVVANVQHGWPYDDAFEASVKAIGLKGKSTDLPHYFEYSGKVGPTKRPVRAELFGRTQAVTDKTSMHLYVAYGSAPEIKRKATK